MANVKKELIGASEKLIEDIFDHYDEYSFSDKMKIQRLMYQMVDLNLELDSYDNPKKATKSKNIFEKFREAVGNFFGKD